MSGDNKITYFGKADYRNKLTPFGIKASDRTRHMYVIGKTGMGKSTLLENLAAQDLQNGEGMGFIDPHGGSAELLLDYIPEHRIKDVIYFAPFDTDYPVAFNVMEDVGKDKRHLVASGLMSAFKKIWVDAWSARMEYILGNTILALLEFPGATLLGVNRMYSDKDYRKKVVDNITDPSIKSFWVDEYAKYGERYTQEATPAIQNKIGQFVANPLIRNIIGQSKSTFDIRDVMDKKKILIMNLSKGKVGDQNTSLLGSMLITKIYLAAMSRADATRSEMAELPNFYFFVDEFQSFANESFADILSEARKYKLNLTIAHQYIEQMPEEVRAAVFGNVGTMVTYRVGSYDADVLEKEFLPAFTAEDIVNLDKYQMYLRLMIDGVGSKPFSAIGLPPIAKSAHSYKEEIIAHSRAFFAKKREDVEQEILDWHRMSFADKKPEPAPYVPPAGTPIVANRPSEISQKAPEQFSAPRPAYQPAAPRAQSPAPYQQRPLQDRRQYDRRREETPRPYGNPDRRKEPYTYDRRSAPETVAPTQTSAPAIYNEPIAPASAPHAPSQPKVMEPTQPNVQVAFTPAQTISLSSLKKGREEKPAETPNKNQLKEALSALMKEKPASALASSGVAKPASVENSTSTKSASPESSATTKPASVPSRPETPKPVSTPAPSPSKDPVSSSHGYKPKEIPEAVLRDMLKIDEEK